MKIVALIMLVLLLATCASASLQEKWTLGPIGTIEEAEFIQDIRPFHRYYLGYDFVAVNIYPNETVRIAVNIVNRDNRFREAFFTVNCQGTTGQEESIITLAPGCSRLFESGYLPYKVGESLEMTDYGLPIYDICINLAADWGQPPLMAQVKMSDGIGLGNWYTGLYN